MVGGPTYGWGFWFSRDRRSVPLGVRTSKAFHDAVNAGVIEGVTLVTAWLTLGVMLVVVAKVRQGMKRPTLGSLSPEGNVRRPAIGNAIG